MVLKLFLLVIVVFAVIALVGNLSPQGGMTGAIQNIQSSVVTVAYVGEFNEINDIVKEFIELREMRGSDDAQLDAAKLDERINNLGLVKTYCKESLSTMELAFDQNPYERLQEMCPALKDISFSRAVELFRLI